MGVGESTVIFIGAPNWSTFVTSMFKLPGFDGSLYVNSVKS